MPKGTIITPKYKVDRDVVTVSVNLVPRKVLDKLRKKLFNESKRTGKHIVTVSELLRNFLVHASEEDFPELR